MDLKVTEGIIRITQLWIYGKKLKKNRPRFSARNSKIFIGVQYGEKKWPKRQRRATFKFWPKIECKHVQYNMVRSILVLSRVPIILKYEFTGTVNRVTLFDSITRNECKLVTLQCVCQCCVCRPTVVKMPCSPLGSRIQDYTLHIL